MSRQWWPYPIFAHTSKMQCNGFFDSLKGNINVFPGCYTPGKIWHGGSPITTRIFVYADQIL